MIIVSLWSCGAYWLIDMAMRFSTFFDDSLKNADHNKTALYLYVFLAVFASLMSAAVAAVDSQYGWGVVAFCLFSLGGFAWTFALGSVIGGLNVHNHFDHKMNQLIATAKSLASENTKLQEQNGELKKAVSESDPSHASEFKKLVDENKLLKVANEKLLKDQEAVLAVFKKSATSTSDLNDANSGA